MDNLEHFKIILTKLRESEFDQKCYTGWDGCGCILYHYETKILKKRVLDTDGGEEYYCRLLGVSEDQFHYITGTPGHIIRVAKKHGWPIHKEFKLLHAILRIEFVLRYNGRFTEK